MKKLLSTIIDLIYRKKCYFCGKSKESVKMCSECYNALFFNDARPNRIINGVNIYSCGIYDKYLQKLIRGLKYHKQRELAHYLAKFMYNYISKIGLNGDYQIIPVPLHKNRIKKRKYNHMELVAEELSKLSGYKINFNLIKRIKDTRPQYKLNRKERMQNLSEAFVINPEADLGLPLLIIDDICTTGSTFEEMINTLKQNGLNNIVCFSASNP